MNALLRPVTPSFSAQEFRSALGSFATGVTVVTALDPSGKPVGLTANSFNSVSLSPPLVLWSLSEAGGLDAGVQRRPRTTRSTSWRPSSACWQSGLPPRTSTVLPVSPSAAAAGGAPVIEGSAAVFECFNRSQYEEGDHIIFVGEVERCERREGALPLIYHGGRYFTELPL